MHVTVSCHLTVHRHAAIHRAVVDRGWVSLRGAARLQLDTEPGADRGPHAGSPRGVVVATGSNAQLRLCTKSLSLYQNRER